MTPKKYPQNIHTPKNINFSENPLKYLNSNLRPQKMAGAYVRIKIPPPPVHKVIL